MQELNDFYNDGFGWTCRQCERELKAQSDETAQQRFFREGEADIRHPRAALAKWADPARTTLMCPRCGITELADLA